MSTLQSLSTLQLQTPAISASVVDAAADDPLLRLAGPVAGSHVLVIASNGLDLMCSLLRQGCAAATTLCPAERPDARAYDLVLAPHVAASVQVGRLAQQARRALLPTGRFLAFVPDAAGRPEDDIGRLMVRTLRLAGFATVRSKAVANGLLVRAELAKLEWPGAATEAACAIPIRSRMAS